MICPCCGVILPGLEYMDDERCYYCGNRLLDDCVILGDDDSDNDDDSE